MMEPFTVLPSAQPVVEMRILPLTVWASTSPASDAASTSPFTARPMNCTPAGTRTVNSTLTSLLLTFIRPPEPGWHSLGCPQSLVGYTAQTVTPSLCGTAWIETELGSL